MRVGWDREVTGVGGVLVAAVGAVTLGGIKMSTG
jgi:hypothetical protein